MAPLKRKARRRSTVRSKTVRATLRLLLLDDNASHAHLIHQVLKKGLPPFTLDVAETPAKAFAKIRSHQYQLILTDFTLKGITGKVIIPTLRSLAPDTPLVVITGKGDEKNAAQAIKLGADYYIAKNQEALITLPHILQKALAKKHHRGTTVWQLPQAVIGHLRSELEHLSHIATDIRNLGRKQMQRSQADRFVEQVQRVKTLTQSLLKSLT